MPALHNDQFLIVQGGAFREVRYKFKVLFLSSTETVNPGEGVPYRYVPKFRRDYLRYTGNKFLSITFQVRVSDFDTSMYYHTNTSISISFRHHLRLSVHSFQCLS